MRRDPTYEELAAAYPELDKAGQDLVEVVLKETPNSFGLTPPEAFVLLASPSCIDGWMCPDSPTGACEYEGGDPDSCDYCEHPEERK